MSSASEAFGRSVPPTFTFRLEVFSDGESVEAVGRLVARVDGRASMTRSRDGATYVVEARVRGDRTAAWDRGVEAMVAEGMVASRW